MVQRKGLGHGSGRKGYYNLIPRDPTIHSQSARGLKQPQLKLARFGLRQRKLGTKQVIGIKRPSANWRYNLVQPETDQDSRWIVEVRNDADLHSDGDNLNLGFDTKEGALKFISQHKKTHQPLKDLTFKALQKRGLRMKYWGDADKDGVPNVKDCRPLDRKKQGGSHFWKVMDEHGIKIVGTPEEKKVIRQTFEKRPELLNTAQGMTFFIGKGDTAYVLPTNDMGTAPLYKAEYIALNKALFRKRLTSIPELKGNHADTIGAVIVHELEHRRQAHKDFKTYDRESEFERIRLETSSKKVPHAEYVKMPLEAPAYKEMLRKRQRDIHVPIKKREAAFRAVFL